MRGPITLAVHETGKPARYPLQEAAEAALHYLTHATSDDFARGADREVRRQLCDALGIDWAAYDRGEVR